MICADRAGATTLIRRRRFMAASWAHRAQNTRREGDPSSQVPLLTGLGLFVAISCLRCRLVLGNLGNRHIPPRFAVGSGHERIGLDLDEHRTCLRDLQQVLEIARRYSSRAARLRRGPPRWRPGRRAASRRPSAQRSGCGSGTRFPKRSDPMLSDNEPIDAKPRFWTSTTVSFTCSWTAVSSSCDIIRYEPSPTRTNTSRSGAAIFTPRPPAIS